MTGELFGKATKKDALKRADGRCEMEWGGIRCANLFDERRPEFHHRIERFLGGRNTLENCVVSCIPCHRLITKMRKPVLDKVERILEKKAGVTRIKQKIPNRGWR